MTDEKLKEIPFNRPYLVGNEMEYIAEAFNNKCVSGNGPFTRHVQTLLEEQLDRVYRVLLTTSCTHALEMSAILLNIQPDDEVILPSYTFVSTALAFAMRGARMKFADIRRDTLNIDEMAIEKLITDKTRAIVPVHYAGVGCEMDFIMELAKKYQLAVIEDNAHGLYGEYKKRFLGTIGHMATLSFHETKNIVCGEGGALIINDPGFVERAEIIRDKGTNRARFFRGEVDKYTWVDEGSSYVMSDILAAFLYGQLMNAQDLQLSRKTLWKRYFSQLESWASENSVTLPVVPEYCDQSYHMFYLLMPTADARDRFIDYMKEKGICTVFHYQPLHLSEMGRKLGDENAHCPVACDVSERIVRLPFYNYMPEEDLARVIDAVREFKV